MDTRIFVGDYTTGTIALRHESYDGSKLGPLRFAARYSASFRNEGFSRLSASTRPSRSATRTSSTAAGLPLRAVVCMRAYKKLPQLYDVAVLVATLDQSAGRRAGPLRRPGPELRERAAPRQATTSRPTDG